jgi:hypothetical protein
MEAIGKDINVAIARKVKESGVCNAVKLDKEDDEAEVDIYPDTKVNA